LLPPSQTHVPTGAHLAPPEALRDASESALATDQNHLIDRLPADDRERLLAVCESVDLVLSTVLCERGEATTHAYFPTDAFISLVSLVDGHGGVEVGMVGREGMVGAQLSLGVPTSPLRAIVQGPGSAWRIGTDDLVAQLAGSAALREGLNRYLYVLMSQQATSAACLRFHMIDQRLARWLLMTQDRAHADSFHVTQEFLAYMLGVRRVGVTVAASELQRSGLIEYRRGELTVLDRGSLEKAACSCYAADNETYAALL
jgi:CRP-like cAMP-binding protein